MADKQALLPMRHPQRELFVPDVADVAFKDDFASMEHPVFALATRPGAAPRVYTHGDVRLTVTPSVLGHATVFDKDILVYAVSHLMAALNSGKPISQTIHVSARDFLISTNRNTGGRDYRELEAALTRLRGTTLTTNIRTGDTAETKIFGIVDSSSFTYHETSGRVSGLQIKLSDWYYRAVLSGEVLTLDPAYFRLRKPLERRMYELARKHCGSQPTWSISFDVLKKKTGAITNDRRMRQFLRDIVEQNHLPQYTVSMDDAGKVITFRNRKELLKQAHVPDTAYGLTGEQFEEARGLLAGWDVHHVYAAWRRWAEEGGFTNPRDPFAAFLGFCRKWVEKRGQAL